MAARPSENWKKSLCSSGQALTLTVPRKCSLSLKKAEGKERQKEPATQTAVVKSPGAHNKDVVLRPVYSYSTQASILAY